MSAKSKKARARGGGRKAVGCTAALLWIGASAPALAAAFNEPAGHGVVIVRGIFDQGSQSFNRSGHLIDTSPYGKIESFAYVQYGVTDWLQLVLKPDFVSTHIAGSPGGHYTGFGTSEAGAQLQVLALGPAVVAVQGALQLPATTRESNPALIGNTSRNTDAKLLVGVTFDVGPWPSFLDAEAGYRVRTAGAPDEVHLDVTLGARPRPDLLLLLQSFTTIPTAPGTYWLPGSQYSNAEFSVVYDLDPKWSLQLGAYTTVEGRNALREVGLESSVWYRF